MDSFNRSHKLPDNFKGTTKYLLFSDQKIIVKDSDNDVSIFFAQSEFPYDSLKREFLLCFTDDEAYKACVLEPSYCASLGRLESLRDAYRSISETQFRIAAIAQGFVNWERVSRFCGYCGAPTLPFTKDNAQQCSECGTLFFPRISPAVIIAIQKDDAVLLAHNHNFREGLYGLIAGFIETGETAEEAVVREIREEVGIEVEDVTYHMSQSWPFPDSLMFGFSATWKSGEINPDGVEILDAQWFTKDHLPPELPGPKTIAGALFRKITGYTG